MLKSILMKYSFILLMTLTTFTMNAQLTASQQAIDFEATTIDGKQFKLSSLKGSKILLSFYRNGACAMCNFRVHELFLQREELQKAGIKVICVFESSREDMLPYVGKQNVPFIVLSDPEAKLYDMYGIKSSPELINQVTASGVAHTRVEEAAAAGFPLIKQANTNFFRIPADVLIDSDFTIHKIHHSDQIINHLSFEEILQFGSMAIK